MANIQNNLLRDFNKQSQNGVTKNEIVANFHFRYITLGKTR